MKRLFSLCLFIVIAFAFGAEEICVRRSDYLELSTFHFLQLTAMKLFFGMTQLTGIQISLRKNWMLMDSVCGMKTSV